jgi:hypothetical protein
MLTLSRRTVTALAASLGSYALLAVSMSAPAAAADDREIAQALRTGGLVIVVRHAATFPDQADTDPLNFDNIAAQRNLNDKGKMLARQFGDALRRAGVPIGKVYTSKHTEGGLVVSPNENNRRSDAFRKMLAAAPKPGTNTILITHFPNIIAALGKDWFDVKEGKATIFRPENGGYKLVGSVQMDEWPRIAAAHK